MVIKYNSRSIQENMNHYKTSMCLFGIGTENGTNKSAIELMNNNVNKSTKIDILEGMKIKMIFDVRKLAIDTILQTDTSHNFTTI